MHTESRTTKIRDLARSGAAERRPAPLSAALRRGTADDHRRAERTGVVYAMLKDTVSRDAYRLYLRNLHEVYAALERCLSLDVSVPKQLALCKLFRASSIADDLHHLAGRDWRTELPVLDSAEAYRMRIEELSGSAATGGLIAHAYVRYLGDLSGGQILRKRLSRRPGLAARELSFYKFDEIDDLQAAKRRFRQALDDFGASRSQGPIVREAQRAFRHNIALSAEVASAPAGPQPSDVLV